MTARTMSPRPASPRNSVSPGRSIDEDDAEQPSRPQRLDDEKQQVSPPPSAAAPSNKRGSFGFRRRKQKAVPVVEDEDVPEEDPVMALFAARSTQRVRFQLEGVEPEQLKAEKRECPTAGPTSPTNIKKFIKGALFPRGSPTKLNSPPSSDEFQLEARKEIESVQKTEGMVWESAETSGGNTVVMDTGTDRFATFSEDAATRAHVTKLLNKARRAQLVHYRYEYAVKCYMRALEYLNQAKYPENHPSVVKTMDSLNQAHHALSSYKNSANIVKMGIKYEDTGEWVRALKMYTIAYRIRRDNLSRSHPSLVVLLNMLGSIQVKRGELEEAMQIYELALKDQPAASEGSDNVQEEMPPPSTNLLARSVTYREMGVVHEKWDETDEALHMYNRSLDCIADYKGLLTVPEKGSPKHSSSPKKFAQLSLERVRLTQAVPNHASTDDAQGGMELFIGPDQKGSRRRGPLLKTGSSYDHFFPPSLDDRPKKKKGGKDFLPSPKNKESTKKKTVDEKRSDHADLDVALTLHQIAQLHRRLGDFELALAAYNVSLRGMKYCLGKNHPNVAAVLGNVGNLQKDMGDMDAAFETYQQVLGIESYRLGLSHPDVAITLHNIATIDAARGNLEHALALYKQVIALQRKLFGDDNVTVAVTSACMGDVYERLGDLKNATSCFDEAVRIKTSAFGRHSLEVARILHKLGKLAFARGDFQLADSYISRAILIYRLKKLPEQDEWVVDAYRDGADIDAAIAMGRGITFEC